MTHQTNRKGTPDSKTQQKKREKNSRNLNVFFLFFFCEAKFSFSVNNISATVGHWVRQVKPAGCGTSGRKECGTATIRCIRMVFFFLSDEEWTVDYTETPYLPQTTAQKHFRQPKTTTDAALHDNEPKHRNRLVTTQSTKKHQKLLTPIYTYFSFYIQFT